MKSELNSNPPCHYCHWRPWNSCRIAWEEVIFDWQGIAHYEFIAEGATVSKSRYKEVLTHLWEVINSKYPKTWVAKDFSVTWQCSSHLSLLDQDYLENIVQLVCPLPPYSSSFIPPTSSSYYFLWMKGQLKAAMGIKWLQRLLHKYVLAPRKVSNNSMITGSRVCLLVDSILKSAMPKGFLIVQISGYHICPRIFWNYHIVFAEEVRYQTEWKPSVPLPGQHILFSGIDLIKRI
jgi:hypothetical protein